MYTDRQIVLANAAQTLNRPDQPWEVTVKGNSIVARWRWADPTFFTPKQATKRVRHFKFTAKLKQKGRWTEHERRVCMTLLGGSARPVEYHLGVNPLTGQPGLGGFAFEEALIKNPIRQYLTACDWKETLSLRNILCAIGYVLSSF